MWMGADGVRQVCPELADRSGADRAKARASLNHSCRRLGRRPAHRRERDGMDDDEFWEQVAAVPEQRLLSGRSVDFPSHVSAQPRPSGFVPPGRVSSSSGTPLLGRDMQPSSSQAPSHRQQGQHRAPGSFSAPRGAAAPHGPAGGKAAFAVRASPMDASDAQFWGAAGSQQRTPLSSSNDPRGRQQPPSAPHQKRWSEEAGDGSGVSFVSSPESSEGGDAQHAADLMSRKHSELKLMCKERGLRVTGASIGADDGRVCYSLHFERGLQPTQVVLCLTPGNKSILVARLLGTDEQQAQPEARSKAQQRQTPAAGSKPLAARAVEYALEQAGVDYVGDVSGCLKYVSEVSLLSVVLCFPRPRASLASHSCSRLLCCRRALQLQYVKSSGLGDPTLLLDERVAEGQCDGCGELLSFKVCPCEQEKISIHTADSLQQLFGHSVYFFCLRQTTPPPHIIRACTRATKAVSDH